MLSRVVAGGIAAFILVMPAISSGETVAPDAAALPAQVAMTAPAPDQSQAQEQTATRAQPEDRAQGPSQTQAQPKDQVQNPSQTQDQANNRAAALMQVPAADSTQILLVGSPKPDSTPPIKLAALDSAPPSATLRVLAVPAAPPSPTQGPAVGSTQVLLVGSPKPDNAPPTRLAALDPAPPSAASRVLAVPALPPPAVAEPFGLGTVPVVVGEILTKWSGVEAGLRAESAILARCRTDDSKSCPAAARAFLAIVAQGRAQTGRARFGVINRAVNMAIIPTSDLAQWGVIDRWSPPLETFGTGRGDCEDYAIAKYAALIEAGVAAADLRLVIVRNLAANEDHAVVAARIDRDWFILDNRWLKMVDASEMSESIPLFVLDQTGARQFAPAALPVASRAAPASF
jgi:predicted transglutaminase-like cysteine proteinase